MTKTPIKISTLEEYINLDDGTDKRYEIEDEVLVEKCLLVLASMRRLSPYY